MLPGQPVPWRDYSGLNEQNKLACVERCWVHAISTYGDQVLPAPVASPDEAVVQLLLREATLMAVLREWLQTVPERAQRVASAWRSTALPATAQHALVSAMDVIADTFGVKVVRLKSAWTVISLYTLRQASVWGLVPRIGKRALDGDPFGTQISIRMFADPTSRAALALLLAPISNKCSCGERATFAAESDLFPMRCRDCKFPTDTKRASVVFGERYPYMIKECSISPLAADARLRRAMQTMYSRGKFHPSWRDALSRIFEGQEAPRSIPGPDPLPDDHHPYALAPPFLRTRMEFLPRLEVDHMSIMWWAGALQPIISPTLVFIVNTFPGHSHTSIFSYQEFTSRAGGRKRLARKKVENALVLGPRLWTTDARAALLSFVLK